MPAQPLHHHRGRHLRKLRQQAPNEFAGQAIRCRQLDILPVEWIARGYLAGLGWESYHQTGQISGVQIPACLQDGSQLPEPVFTPSTTTDPAEGHDEHISGAQVEKLVGAETTAQLGRLTVDLYTRGAEIARGRIGAVWRRCRG